MCGLGLSVSRTFGDKHALVDVILERLVWDACLFDWVCQCRVTPEGGGPEMASLPSGANGDHL